MRRLKLYLKMAVQNISANRRFYFPYSLCCIGLTAMFYIMNFLTYDPMITEMRGAVYVQRTMVLGVIVLGIFSVFLLAYANSFIIRRRRRELGLYNILGMEKRHISVLMVVEELLLAACCLVIGIGFGLLFSKFTILLLAAILREGVPMGFSVSGKAIFVTLIVYSGIFLLCLLKNIRAVLKSSPIELLHSSNAGEREPKGRPLLTAGGILMLGGGYAIAILTSNPIQALTNFFVAVLLVIFGTYMLFTVGSVSILGLLRRNKRFYYRPGPFTAISGLLYRMKQNAVGMANICILSTMVLVTVSSTVCLYAGMGDMTRNQYPYEIEVHQILRMQGEDFDDLDNPSLQERLSDTLMAAAGEKAEVTSSDRYINLSFTVTNRGNNVYTIDTNNYYDVRNIATLNILLLSDYNRMTGKNETLAPGEVFVEGKNQRDGASLTIGNERYTVKKALDDFPLGDWEALNMMSDALNLVLPDEDALCALYDEQLSTYGNRASRIDSVTGIELSGTPDQKLAAYDRVREAAQALTDGEGSTLGGASWGTHFTMQSRQANLDELCSFNGSFLFLGIFLGLVFMMAAVLIIYYKQVSEGYADRERYEIMQKIGMDARSVKKSIESQVLLVFFLPLLTAGVHILFAFPLISSLFRLFSLSNTSLFAGCTAGTFLVFAVIYVTVYLLTARTYYKIVGESGRRKG